MLVYRCLHGLAPPYLASDLQRVADLDDRRRLRSSLTDALNVPSTRAGSVSVFVFLVGFSKVGIGFDIGFSKYRDIGFRFFRTNLPLLIE